MIIAIAGKKNSGKSLVSSIILRHLTRAIAIGLADPIRTFVAELSGISIDELHRLKNHPSFDIRKAMQSLGTEWGRALNPDIWVDHWERKTVAAMSGVLVQPVKEGSHFGGHRLEKYDHVVVPDLRFVNEAKRVKQLGGLLLFKEGGAEGDGHRSETEMMGEEFQTLVDYRIKFHKDIDALDAEVIGLLDRQLWTPIRT